MPHDEAIMNGKHTDSGNQSTTLRIYINTVYIYHFHKSDVINVLGERR